MTLLPPLSYGYQQIKIRPDTDEVIPVYQNLDLVLCAFAEHCLIRLLECIIGIK